MYIEKLVIELITLIQTKNKEKWRFLKLEREISGYLTHAKNRSDCEKDKTIIDLLSQNQLSEWGIAVNGLDQDESRTLIKYLIDEQQNDNNSQELKQNVANMLRIITDFFAMKNLPNPIECEQQKKSLKQKNSNNSNDFFNNESDHKVESENLIKSEYSPSFLMSMSDFIVENPGTAFVCILSIAALAVGIAAIAIGSCGIGLGVLTAAATMAVGGGLLGASVIGYGSGVAYTIFCKPNDRGRDDRYQANDAEQSKRF